MAVDTQQLSKLGAFVKGQLDSYINDRAYLERQCLKNLRQYRRKYDPEVLNLIAPDKSQSYPGDTRIIVKGAVAKVMEMMFPAQDKNWSITHSPNPSIPEDALQQVIEEVQATAQEGDDIDELMERKIREFAKKRAELMEAEIHDQLVDASIDYPQLCKRVTRSGFIYGIGIVRSPMVRTQTVRTWKRDETTGTLVAVPEKVRRPFAEFVRFWDFYPDLSAKTWEDQELVFERSVLMRQDVRKLADRQDFNRAAILEYLRNHPTGNYMEKSYESELREISMTSNVADKQSRRYEVYRALGFFSGHQLRGVGVPGVDDENLADSYFVDLWFIDDVVIKARLASFGGDRPSDQYHAFVYSEDEDSGITGIGLPEEVRDSQMGICAATRMLMDNMAATAGPMLEVNTSLLPRGRKTIGSLHAFKVIEREGDGQDAMYPAVRDIRTQNHVPTILSVLEMQRQQMDIESNLPAYTMGAMQQPLGEAFRTSNNMSMMLGSANMVTKDTVRAFDKFIASFIGSLLRWNQKYNPNEKIKGDFEVVAKGNLSLVAKEVRGAALDQFVQVLTPEERAILDTYGLLIDRLKARDLPIDRVIPRAEAEKILAGMRESAAQAAQIEQGLTQAKTQKEQAAAEHTQTKTQITAQTADAVLQEILSRVESNMANAKSANDRNQLENLKVLLSTVQGEKNGAGSTGNTSEPPAQPIQ